MPEAKAKPKAKVKAKAKVKVKAKAKEAVQAVADQKADFVESGVRKRCNWLNANIFWDGAIDQSAMESLAAIGFQRAMELCKDVEEKGADDIQNPSAYLQKAARYELRLQQKGGGDAHAWQTDARRQPAPVWEDGSKDYDTMHKRCTWLNMNVFWEGAISEQAIAALSRLPAPRAKEICTELEAKADRVQNPSNFLTRAVDRELPSGYAEEWWGDDYWPAPSGHGKGGRHIEASIHRRCTWLNANVLWPGAIDEDAIASLSSMDNPARAMEMLKDIESRGPNGTANPSSYIVGSVRHEFEQPNASYGSHALHWSGDGGGGYVNDVIHRRCTWLNANVFWEGAISDASISSLSGLEVSRGLEILQDLEWKAEGVQNPSKWIQATIENQWPTGSYVDSRLHRRCIWLNANVFWEGGIDEDAIRAISSLDYSRAMALCSDLEVKGQRVADPSRYLKTAVRREQDLWL